MSNLSLADFLFWERKSESPRLFVTGDYILLSLFASSVDLREENLNVGVATGSFRSLLSLSVIGILLLVFFTYLSLSNSSSVNQTHLSITTQKLVTNSSQIQFGGAWHYVGNTTEHFNDICPDAGLGIDCVALTNPPPSIEEWYNGTVTAFVGQIKTCGNDLPCQWYSVVIINNSTYCVAPKVEDRPSCPPIID